MGVGIGVGGYFGDLQLKNDGGAVGIEINRRGAAIPAGGSDGSEGAGGSGAGTTSMTRPVSSPREWVRTEIVAEGERVHASV